MHGLSFLNHRNCLLSHFLETGSALHCKHVWAKLFSVAKTKLFFLNLPITTNLPTLPTFAHCLSRMLIMSCLYRNPFFFLQHSQHFKLMKTFLQCHKESRNCHCLYIGLLFCSQFAGSGSSNIGVPLVAEWTLTKRLQHSLGKRYKCMESVLLEVWRGRQLFPTTFLWIGTLSQSYRCYVT